jgi:predicted Zn-dependent protease
MMLISHIRLPLFGLSYLRHFVRIVCGVTFLMFAHGTVVFAQDYETNSEDAVASRAREAWIDGSSVHALDILEQALRKNPHSLMFQKLRGDILTTTRRNQEALDDYEAILKESPESLAIR